MKKTTKQIAEDCECDYGLLEDVMEENFQSDRPLEKELCDTIGALYRRIEFLEEIAYQHGTLKRDFHLKCFALEESHKQTDEANRRIKELEAEKECHIAEIKALESAVAGNAERINSLILSGGKE
jgi:hypothetical protein